MGFRERRGEKRLFWEVVGLFPYMRFLGRRFGENCEQRRFSFFLDSLGSQRKFNGILCWKGKTNREEAFFLGLVRFVEKREKKPTENEEEGIKGYKEETSERAEDIFFLVLFGFGQRRRRVREKDNNKRREAEGSFPGMDILSSLFIFIYHIVRHFCFIVILLDVVF